jgi:hypothetical protein
MFPDKFMLPKKLNIVYRYNIQNLSTTLDSKDYSSRRFFIESLLITTKSLFAKASSTRAFTRKNIIRKHMAHKALLSPRFQFRDFEVFSKN